MSLPPYVPWTLVAERLPLIFAEGTPNRSYCIRELAAKTIFTMIYIGSIEGSGMLFGPKHVYRMTEQQAADSGDESRRQYGTDMLRSGYHAKGSRWYNDTTREPIRDETLQNGLVLVGAVSVLESVPTTSSKPRYALKPDFAALFDPKLRGKALDRAIESWRNANLTKGALMRTRLAVAGAATPGDRVVVMYPSGEARPLSPGPSSVITKAVIEVFAPTFLKAPAVLWLSESATKMVSRDERLAEQVGLPMDAAELLPDVVLVDLGPADPLIVFVEVVHSDGAITDRRQEALWTLTDARGFDRKRVSVR
jgi:hypothetical protein